jgi:thiol-disulfide isomerase/thioredoxin
VPCSLWGFGQLSARRADSRPPTQGSLRLKLSPLFPIPAPFQRFNVLLIPFCETYTGLYASVFFRKWVAGLRSTFRPTLKCPACSASIRVDRVRNHLSSVHPKFRPSKDLRAKIERRDGSRLAKTRARGVPGPIITKWRAVGLAAVVLFAALLAYALTRPIQGPVVAGKAAPDFSFTDLNGNTHSLSSYQGHPVLLWWIATWCPHCTQDTQLFAQNYYSQYYAARVTVLEIQLYNNLGQSGPSLTSFATSNGYSGQPGWTFGAGDSVSTSTYDPQAVTDIYYLLNSQGVVLTLGTGAGGAFGSLLQQAQGQ